jgi:cysteinyl-tRNA synthetase
VRSFDGYGKLSNRDPAEMDQGEEAGTASLKEDPLDFALWKGHKEGEDTSWDSPWGTGRPGWHIECSAMSEKELGPDFAVHGGGIDLVFPHHENEIAQTEAARGVPLARVWMHNGMVQIDEEKMSKSVGNIFQLSEASIATAVRPCRLPRLRPLRQPPPSPMSSSRRRGEGGPHPNYRTRRPESRSLGRSGRPFDARR